MALVARCIGCCDEASFIIVSNPHCSPQLVGLRPGGESQESIGILLKLDDDSLSVDGQQLPGQPHRQATSIQPLINLRFNFNLGPSFYEHESKL